MSKTFVFRICGVTAAVLSSMVLSGGIAIGVEETPWIDQKPTPVALVRPILQDAAIALVKNPILEEQVNRYLRERNIWITFDVPTVRKMEQIYSEIIQPTLYRVAYAEYDVEVLGKLGVPALVMEALKHPDLAVKDDAVRLFADLKYRPAAESLILLLRRNNFLVVGDDEATANWVFKRDLFMALGAITGLDVTKLHPSDTRSIKGFIAKCEAWVKDHPLPKTQPPQQRVPGVKQ